MSLPAAAKADKYIRVDAEVFAELQQRAKPGETPNTVLRRAFRLRKSAQGRRSGTLRPFKENGQP